MSEGNKILKLCRISFDKDQHLMNHDNKAPSANIITNDDNTIIGNIVLGEFGFYIFNKVKVCGVHSSSQMPLATIREIFNDQPDHTKTFMRCMAIEAIKNFEIEESKTSNIVYLVDINEEIDASYIDRDFGLNTFINYCYIYLTKEAQKDKKQIDGQIPMEYHTMGTHTIDDHTVYVFKGRNRVNRTSFIKESNRKFSDFLKEELEKEEDPEHNEYEEEDNPAYSKPDDPEKELNYIYD